LEAAHDPQSAVTVLASGASLVPGESGSEWLSRAKQALARSDAVRVELAELPATFDS
jgi:hypothetical protein